MMLATVLLFVSYCWTMVLSTDPVTHYYNLDIAQMTGAPDGFQRLMLGEDTACSTRFFGYHARMLPFSTYNLNFAVMRIVLYRNQWQITRSYYNSQRR